MYSLLRIQKNNVLIRTLLVLFVSFFVFCNTSQAQQVAVLAHKVTLSLKQVPLKNVLAELEKQVGYDISYRSDLVKAGKVISVDYNNTPLEEALQQLFADDLKTIRVSGNKIFLQLVSKGKGVIQGKVRTSDGKPTEGVSVQLQGTAFVAVTGEDGGYELKAPEGAYLLVVSFTGLQTQQQQIVLVKETTRTADFTLAENNHQLQEVMVRVKKKTYLEKQSAVATKLPVSLKDIPNTVTIVNRQLMNDLNFTTASDAVAMVGGATIISNGDRGQSTAAYSRGYVMPVMNDGIPSQNNFSLTNFDLSMYQQVDVLQGPAGVLQGAGEAGGVINLVRKQALADFNWEASMQAGSWNNYRIDAGITGGLNKKKTIKGRLNVAGQRQNFFYDRTHQNLRFGYGMLEFDIDKKTTLKLSGSLQGIDIEHGFTGLPSNMIDYVPRSANLNLDWQQSHPKANESILQFARALSQNWKLNVSGRYSGNGNYVKNGFVNKVNPVTDSARYVLNEFNKLYTAAWGADVFVRGAFKWLAHTQQLVVGFNYDWNKSKNVMGGFKLTDSVDYRHPNVPEPTYPMTINNQTVTAQYGIYAQLRLKLADPLSVLLGTRTSWYDNKTKSITTDWKADRSLKGKFTPYAGVVYDVNKQIAAYVSYSDIFTPQQTSFSYDQKPLQPRTGFQTEAGVKASFFKDHFQASVAGFYIRDKNRALVDNEHSGSSVTYYVAAGIASGRGAQLQLSGSPFQGLNIMANYSYLITRYDKDTEENYGKSLDVLEPKSQAKIWASYLFLKGPLKNVNIGAGSTYQSKMASYGDYWQAAYAIVNGQLGYRLSNDYSVSFTLNNIFDKKYFQTVNAFYYGAPRNFTVALRKSI